MKNTTHTEELIIEEIEYSTSPNIINWGDQFKHFIIEQRENILPIKTPGTDVFIFAE